MAASGLQAARPQAAAPALAPAQPASSATGNATEEAESLEAFLQTSLAKVTGGTKRYDVELEGADAATQQTTSTSRLLIYSKPGEYFRAHVRSQPLTAIVATSPSAGIESRVPAAFVEAPHAIDAASALSSLSTLRKAFEQSKRHEEMRDYLSARAPSAFDSSLISPAKRRQLPTGGRRNTVTGGEANVASKRWRSLTTIEAPISLGETLTTIIEEFRALQRRFTARGHVTKGQKKVVEGIVVEDTEQMEKPSPFGSPRATPPGTPPSRLQKTVAECAVQAMHGNTQTFEPERTPPRSRSPTPSTSSVPSRMPLDADTPAHTAIHHHRDAVGTSATASCEQPSSFDRKGKGKAKEVEIFTPPRSRPPTQALTPGAENNALLKLGRRASSQDLANAMAAPSMGRRRSSSLPDPLQHPVQVELPDLREDAGISFPGGLLYRLSYFLAFGYSRPEDPLATIDELAIESPAEAILAAQLIRLAFPGMVDYLEQVSFSAMDEVLSTCVVQDLDSRFQDRIEMYIEDHINGVDYLELESWWIRSTGRCAKAMMAIFAINLDRLPNASTTRRDLQSWVLEKAVEYCNEQGLQTDWVEVAAAGIDGADELEAAQGDKLADERPIEAVEQGEGDVSDDARQEVMLDVNKPENVFFRGADVMRAAATFAGVEAASGLSWQALVSKDIERGTLAIDLLRSVVTIEDSFTNLLEYPVKDSVEAFKDELYDSLPDAFWDRLAAWIDARWPKITFTGLRDFLTVEGAMDAMAASSIILRAVPTMPKRATPTIAAKWAIKVAAAWARYNYFQWHFTGDLARITDHTPALAAGRQSADAAIAAQSHDMPKFAFADSMASAEKTADSAARARRYR